MGTDLPRQADLLRHAIGAIGRALRPVRAGMRRVASRGPAFQGVPESIAVECLAFGPGGSIPARFTADGRGVSPPLIWRNLPDGTKSVMLLVEDADIPFPTPLVHALVPAVPAESGGLLEDAIPFRARGGRTAGGLLVGRSGFGRCGWVAPSPPPGHGPHRYVFQVFALDEVPTFDWPPGRGYALRRVRPHVIARGSLTGVYERD